MSKNKKTYSLNEFAEIIGVHPRTIIRWDKTGKYVVKRNKLNNYMVFTDEDVELVKKLLVGEEELKPKNEKNTANS